MCLYAPSRFEYSKRLHTILAWNTQTERSVRIRWSGTFSGCFNRCYSEQGECRDIRLQVDASWYVQYFGGRAPYHPVCLPPQVVCRDPQLRHREPLPGGRTGCRTLHLSNRCNALAPPGTRAAPGTGRWVLPERGAAGAA